MIMEDQMKRTKWYHTPLGDGIISALLMLAFLGACYAMLWIGYFTNYENGGSHVNIHISKSR